MATSFVAHAEVSSSSTSSVVVNKPTGTTTDDLLVAMISRDSSQTSAPTGTPSGWTLIGEVTTTTNGLGYAGAWYKLATGSEPSSYTWTFSAATKTRGDISTYRGGFDTSDIVDISGVRAYSTNSTSFPSVTGLTTSEDGSSAIFVGTQFKTSTATVTPPSGYNEDVDTGDTTSDLWTFFANGEEDAGTYFALATTQTNNAKFTASLVLTPAGIVSEVTGGSYTLTGGAIDSQIRIPSVDGGTYALSGGTVHTQYPIPVAGGTYALTGGAVASKLVQTVTGGIYILTGGAVAESQSTLDISLYRDVLDDAYAIYACNTFGNDTEGDYIWERTDSAKDLILGDGATASTFPTFTTTADKHTEYYAFDGVDDYVDNWPTAGFVSAALSSSYPDGQPYVAQVTDDTVKDLLTVGGAFTGNLHSLVFFATEPTEADKLLLADYQLRRLWREDIVDPYTARLIRNTQAVQVYDFQDSVTPYADYALDSAAVPTSITLDNGITFDGSSSVVTVPDEAALRLQSGATIFVSGDMATGQLVEKGTNYSFEASVSGSDLTLTANGIAAASTASADAKSVCVTLVPGNNPRFYVDGEYHDSGASAVTLPLNTSDLLIGNTSGGGSEFEGTLRRARIFNRVLTDAEIRLCHYGAVLGTDVYQYETLFGVDPFVGTTDLAALQVIYAKYTASASGTGTRVAFEASTASQIKFAVYDDNGSNHPGNRLAVQNTAVPVTPGVNFFNVGGFAVSSGTNYWIAVVPDTTGGTLRTAVGGPTRRWINTGDFSTWAFSDPAINLTALSTSSTLMYRVEG